MESIEKLRELCAKWRKTSITPGRNSAADEVDKIANEIEREISERYMLLPVDADGVPIRVGAEMESYDGKRFIVCALAPGNVHYWSWNNQGERSTLQFTPYQCHYYKPRNIEDVLQEFVDSCCVHTRDELNIIPDLITRYADELRGMGVGE